MTRRSRSRIFGLMTVVVLAGLILTGATTRADTSTAAVQPAAAFEPDAPPPLVINYQGRLVDPSTGEPKPDGPYTAAFALYDADAGGTRLWSESQDIVLSEGLFSVMLGNANPIDPGIFNGNARWLSVTISPDPGELLPRIRVAHAPYAIWSNLAGSAANADRLGGSLPSAYAAAVHSHDASNIVSGNLPVERYHAIDNLSLEGYLGNAAGDIALNNGAKQATLNADQVDGQHSTDFAAASHNHDALYVNVTGDSMSGQLSVGPAPGNAIVGVSSDPVTTYAGVFGNNTGNGFGVKGSSTSNYGGFFYSTNKAGLLADTKTPGGPDLVLGGSDGDGQLSVEPASGANLTLSSENDVKVRLDKDNNGSGVLRIQNSGGGDVVTADEAGVLSATRVSYTAARTHYASVPGEAFSPWADVAYSNGGGCGGAYIAVTGCMALAAPVQLPDGAIVNLFTVFFYDTSANDMTVTLWRQYYTSCGYSSLASISSSGTSGYYNVSDSANAAVDNTTGGYYIQAYSCNWDGGNLKIKGAVVRYTVSEAP